MDEFAFDVRVRDGNDPRLDPEGLFDEVLPQRFAEMADRLAPALAHYDPPPLGIDVEGTEWTLAVAAGRIEVRRGTGETSVGLRLDAEQVADLADDQATTFSWLTAGKLAMQGDFGDLNDWWVLIRATLDDRDPHVPGAVDVSGLDGVRTFTLDDPIQARREHLARYGFLHMRDVFTESEMAAVSADMDVATSGYEQGDGRSWWARTADGTDRLVRMQHFDEVSPTVAQLVADERFLGLADIPDAGYRYGWGEMASNRIEALEKPIGVVEGISDVPWHKDCSLGRHSHDCRALTVGISVSGAGPRSGQLRVVAGSHRALTWPALLRPGLDLPQLDLPTATGDVTIHLSCTLHMAQPPVDQERRVLYTGFRLPRRSGADMSGIRRLHAARESAPVTVSQPSATGTG